MKTQVVIGGPGGRIICAHVGKGRRHDMRMFREGRLPLRKGTMIQADIGYQGIEEVHVNPLIPRKKPKGGALSKEDKRHNRELASQRVAVEHAIRKLKVFRILSCTYRNRRKRLGLRVNLIAAIINACLLI